MTSLQDLRSRAESQDAFDLLEHLLREEFPGKCVVTASLKARSVAVLRMVADIDPATPVVFCHARNLFDESRAYRAEIVSMLGLTRITEARGDRVAPVDKGSDHIECLWVEDPDGGGLVHECVHLNETLASYDCWISAVYGEGPETVRDAERIDMDGRLTKVDPLADWAPTDVQTFLQDRGLPPHPLAKPRAIKSARRDFGKRDTDYYIY